LYETLELEDELEDALAMDMAMDMDLASISTPALMLLFTFISYPPYG
jgi:hypothetical protein